MTSSLIPFFRPALSGLLLILILSQTEVLGQSGSIKPPLDHNIQTFTNEKNEVFVNQHQGYQFLFSGMKTEDQQLLQNERESEVTLPEGQTRIRIMAADGSSTDYPIFVDGSAPTSSITLENTPIFESENGTIYAGKNLRLNYNSSDNASGVQNRYWAVNNGAYNPFRDDDLEFRSNQNYLIYYYVVDRVGNVEDVQRIEFEVDVSGPTVQHNVQGPQNLSVTSSEASISLSAEDNASGINEIYFWFDGNEISTYSAPISLNNLPDGEHTLYAYATDRVQNAGDTLTYNFYLDRDSPLVTADITGNVFQQEATTYISPQSTISLSPEDNRSGISSTHYQLNQEPEQNYTNPIRLPSSSGTYSITFYATDVVGNQGDKQSLKVYVDNGRPTTNIRFQGYYSTTPNGYAISSETLVELTAGDLESGVKEIRYRLDNDDWQTYSEPISFNGTAPKTLTYYATDQVGNRETEHQTEIVIRQQEELTMNAEPERVSTSSSRFMKVGDAIQGPDKEVFLWLSTSSADTSQKIMISHSTDSSQVFPINMNADKENIVTIAVNGENASYPVTIDGTSPSSNIQPSGAKSFTSSEDALIFAPGVSLSFSAVDNITGVKEIYASENGGRYQLYDKPLSGYFSEQKYAIRYYAVDEVGNEEEENLYEFSVDATPPITTHSFLNNYSGSNLSLFTTIELEAVDNMSGVDTTYIQLNDNKAVQYAGELQLSELGDFEEAFNTIYYYSVDKVGNTEQRKQFNFKIDKTGPTVEVSWRGDYHTAEDQTFIHPSTKMVLNASDSEMEIRNIWFQKTSNGERITYQEPISFQNGESTQINFSAVDVLGNQGEIYEEMIVVDSASPSSRYSITGQTLDNGETIILGDGAHIDLTATDNLAGTAQIRYGINTENLIPYSNTIQFGTSGNKVIRYQAVDRVGNVEELKTLSVVYDQDAPIIDISFSKEANSQTQNSATIDSETLISVTSVDNESEVKSLEYKWNEDSFSAYFRPIKNSETGTHTLTIRTTDVLGNQRTQTMEIEVMD